MSEENIDLDALESPVVAAKDKSRRAGRLGCNIDVCDIQHYIYQQIG